MKKLKEELKRKEARTNSDEMIERFNIVNKLSTLDPKTKCETKQRSLESSILPHIKTENPREKDIIEAF